MSAWIDTGLAPGRLAGAVVLGVVLGVADVVEVAEGVDAGPPASLDVPEASGGVAVAEATGPGAVSVVPATGSADEQAATSATASPAVTPARSERDAGRRAAKAAGTGDAGRRRITQSHPATRHPPAAGDAPPTMATVS
ncbi:hypothetical protein [Terracoccus luteus]|uniref:Uncharacterized protein n=1 Tax=Terracoccus luteus TaxID=53356 RepID=A0A839PVU7_9MICO|nr:hypothetical protein [Terracoccus luteus]MBB2988368.1 hypothetical protein [Terracoccus luteus]MCP2174002.1 hypothetical protein [Terracoccus luteus]